MRRFFILLVALTACLGGASSLLPNHAAAVSGSEWIAGRIIDDSVFTDSNSMTYNQVEWFLMSKMPSCDNSGALMVNGMTRAAYADSKGNPKPSGTQTFTCLKDYYEVPKTAPGPGIPASNYGYATGHAPAGSESAAQIILDAAHAYNISPKTLLVTLQKESSLVTDDWPFQSEYTYAMGADCPDGPNGANCDPNYAGFSLQMMEGAKLLRSYLDNMTQPWWTYKKPYANNDILWNVASTNCGSANVYIQTMATAALYTYTPYQPNQAALSNLYGTGDGCSAYGNRNFWVTFSDWFGTTDGDLFQASNVGQSIYPNVIPGQSQPVTLKYRNSGQWTLHDSTVNWPGIPPLYLAASSGPSMFSYGWPSANVAAINFSHVYESDGATLAANQHQADPGQIIEFDFNATAPWTAKTGAYPISFKPVIAGTTIDLGPFSNATMNINVPPLFASTLVAQSTYPELSPGQGQQIAIKYRNSGQWAWHDDSQSWPGMPALYLGTANPTGSSSIFGYGWPNPGLAARNFGHVYESDGTTLASNQHEVNPGQIAEFDFNVTAPWTIDGGAYPVSFAPILFGSGVDFGKDAISTMIINIPRWKATNVGQSVYPTVPQGQSSSVFMRFKNLGAWTWHDSTVNWPGVPALTLGTADGSNSIFAYGWPSGNTATTTFAHVYESDGATLAANQHQAGPGQIVQFNFTMTTPWAATSGSYPQFFRPVLSGNASIDFSSGARSQMNVNVP